MRRTRGDAGFALATLICIITAAAVLTAMMVPLHVMQSRRDVEQELIFRGQEYTRAIRKYQLKYGIYPSSIDDLVSRDGLRFLRRQYKDPITGDDFRLINVNADGSLTGSLTLLSVPVSTQQNGMGGGQPGTLDGGAGAPLAGGGGNNARGNTSGPNGVQTGANTNNVGNMGGLGSSMGLGGNGGLSGFGGGNTGSNNGRVGVSNGVGTGAGGGVGTGAGTGVGGGGGFGGAITPGSLGGGGLMGNPLGIGSNTQQTNTGNRANSGGGTNPFPTAGGGAAAPTAGAQSALSGTGFMGTGTGATGGGIPQVSPGVAGVASESTKTSVMIYNEKEKYNEWEFIAPFVQTAANQGASGPSGGGRGGPTPTGGRGTSGPGSGIGPTGNPLSGGGTSPFGGGGIGGAGGGVGFGAPAGPVGVGTPAGGGTRGTQR